MCLPRLVFGTVKRTRNNGPKRVVYIIVNNIGSVFRLIHRISIGAKRAQIILQLLPAPSFPLRTVSCVLQNFTAHSVRVFIVLLLNALNTERHKRNSRTPNGSNYSVRSPQRRFSPIACGARCVVTNRSR